MEITDQVLQTLNETGKPMKSGEIALSIGIDKAVVDKAIQQLKKKEAIFSPKNCYYEVKK